MNKQRAKALEALNEEIETLRARLEELRDEEQAYRDSLPESMQEGARASVSDDCLEHLDGALDSMQEAADSVRGCYEAAR